jgi:uncharacterized protein YdaL
VLQSKIGRKRVTFLVLALCLVIGTTVKADVNADPREDTKTLIVYTTNGGHVSESQKLLDMLVGHFAKKIEMKSANNLTVKDIEGVSTLIYYGEIADLLPEETESIFNRFEGTILAIGHNSEQLGIKYAFFNQERQVAVKDLVLAETGRRTTLEGPRLVSTIVPTKETEVLITGTSNGTSYPVMIRNKEYYYFASDNIDSIFSLYLGEALHEVFKADHSSGHPAYLRLEDVHPLTDASILREIAVILKRKNIPYIVSVIPVYRDPDTGEEFRFSDFPQLLSTLKYAQKNGGTIIMHGYTHQYKNDETGEGFEFWDVDANMPITVPADQTPEKKTRADFKSNEEFLKFLANQKAFETDYIKTKVTKAIQELVGLGLYPLAFEAPHYTMSQSGYEILADHFSTYIGQLQLGDRDWRIMAPSPYVSYPSFLHGMKLLPETIGYVEPENPVAIDDMMRAADNMLVVRDGYIAGFYHPYLGLERFNQLIDKFEKIPNLEWIDLKKMNNYVAVDSIALSASTENEVTKTVDYFEMLKTSPEYYAPHMKTAVNYTMWSIGALSAIMILLFIYFAIRLHIQRIRFDGGGNDE